jgi:hypothetical protein
MLQIRRTLRGGALRPSKVGVGLAQGSESFRT